MTFFRFFFSRIFIANIILALILGLVLLVGTFWTINVYTKHGDNISVPDFTGLSLKQVEELTAERGLRYKVIDSVYNNYRRRGSILEQSPKPGSNVKEDRIVYLTINAFLPEMVNMPRIVEITLIQAVTDLEAYGLRVGNLHYVKHKYKNWVLKQMYAAREIEPGTRLTKGSKIDLVLGSGYEKPITVIPILLKLTEREAKRRTVEAHLNLKGLYYDQSVKNYEDSLNAQVWKQEPFYEKNLKVELGSEVSIWLSCNMVKVEEAYHNYKLNIIKKEEDKFKNTNENEQHEEEQAD